MNFFKKILMSISTPIRLFLPHDFLEKIGISSIREERNNLVMKFVQGRLLDIGCGKNILVENMAIIVSALISTIAEPI